jgi:3'-5' exonuclease
MLKKIDLSKILFLDIETAPQTYKYEDLDATTAKLFGDKTRFMIKEDSPVEEVYDKRASIYAEFGKIVAISCGFIAETRAGKQIRLKSFYHEDEETLLMQFVRMVNEHFGSPYHAMCAHNGKEFDFPYIARRLLIHGLDLPEMLNIAGKKPWEVNHLDTMELWKFGDYKSFTSLPLLCHVFGIPTPKDDISGADVARVYWEENDVKRIAKYCEKDVVALIQLLLRMRGDNLVDESEIHFTVELQ